MASRGKLWSDEATNCLIELWSEETIQYSLNNSKTSRETSEVYKTLQTQLHAKGFERFSVKEVINKMKKLRQKYKKEKDKCRISGNGSSRRKWKFFSRMDNILSARHNVSPPIVVDSMTLQEKKEDSSVVQDLVHKYGKGKVTVEKCHTCNYEKEIYSTGVHEAESGSLRVYSEEEEFFCPRCNKDESNDFDVEDADIGVTMADTNVKMTEKMKVIQIPNTCVKETDDQSTPKEDVKLQIVQKKKRKPNIEKSLEAVFAKFQETSNSEFLRFQQMQEERFKREQEFRIQQRREEREHEFRMMT